MSVNHVSIGRGSLMAPFSRDALRTCHARVVVVAGGLVVLPFIVMAGAAVMFAVTLAIGAVIMVADVARRVRTTLFPY